MLSCAYAQVTLGERCEAHFRCGRRLEEAIMLSLTFWV